jgi:hypothetical protein
MQRSSRNGTTQVVAFDATATVTNAFGAETYQIRISANSACHYIIGNGTLAATVSEAFLPANVIEYVTVTPGQKIAFIKAATGGLVTGTAGSAWVTELS